MKKTISRDIATQKDRNILIAYLAAWLTSPLINVDRMDEIFFSFSVDEGAYEPPEPTATIPTSNRSSIKSPKKTTSDSKSKRKGPK